MKTRVGGDALKQAREGMQRLRTNRLVAQALELREGERKCRVTKKNGKKCGKYAIRGGFVCTHHGGSAPQVRASANKRLLALVEPSLVRLGDLIQQSEHMPTALGAIRTVLERAGSTTPIGPINKDPGESAPKQIVNIGIAIGGLTPEKLAEIQMKQLASRNPIDAEVVEDDDE